MCELWNGFQLERFQFENKDALIVSPAEGTSVGRLAIKTVYWDAFPEAIELDLVKHGFHLCYIKSDHRWGAVEDIDRMARYVRFVSDKYALQRRVVPVGMSCGGLMAIKLADKYPEIISCLYLDAPVLNYLSCPGCFGDAKREDVKIVVDEVLNALKMESISQLIAYRQMPLDALPNLIASKIPSVLVAGLADRVVPYHENGKYLQDAYIASNVDFEYYLKPGCDHHPHGLENNAPVLRFILTH